MMRLMCVMKMVAFGQNQERLSQLLAVLNANGFAVVEAIDDERTLYKESKLLKADALVVYGQRVSTPVLQAIQLFQMSSPRPVVVFADQTDEKLTEQVVRSGVVSYVIDNFDAKRVKNIIDTAVIRHREVQQIVDELANTKLSLSQRKEIEKAKGLLMKRNGMDEGEAYKAMRELAMSQNKKMIDIASSILNIAMKQN